MRNQIMRLQASVPVLRAPVPKQQDAKSPEMTTYESDLLNVLTQRGYVHQVTDAAGLDALAMRQTVPGYIGFDATAPSLHVGSLVQIMMLRRLQQTGILRRVATCRPTSGWASSTTCCGSTRTT